MSSTLTDHTTARPRLNVDPGRRMAKAAIQIPDSAMDRQESAAILRAALSLLGWTNDRFAREAKKDPSQTARWQRGDEAYRFETIWQVEELRHAFWRVLGERLPDVEITVRAVLRKEIA